MAYLYDLARMTTATTGTGTITLGSAATVGGTTYLSFAAAGVADGATVTYAIADTNASEIGRGVYTASGTTLTRATILKSTNSNAAINLSGTAQVFVTAAAEDIQPWTAQYGPFTSLSSAATTDLSTVSSVGVNITGNTTITSLGTGAYLFRIVKFAAALTLTYNASSLILPTNANILTAAGDTFISVSDGSGNWTVVNYSRATGATLSLVPTPFPFGAL